MKILQARSLKQHGTRTCGPLPAQTRTACAHASRRKIIRLGIAAFGLSFVETPDAQAGWDGPAKFLKGRQQANVEKLTAPFSVSLQRLQIAQELIEGNSDGSAEAYASALELVRRASCNCYEFEAFGTDSIETKVSLFTQKFKLADPCTFRIVAKNVVSLMDTSNPLKSEIEDRLDQLVRCYSQLDDALLEASEWGSPSEARGKVGPLLDRTIKQQQALMAAVQRGIGQELSIA